MWTQDADIFLECNTRTPPPSYTPTRHFFCFHLAARRHYTHSRGLPNNFGVQVEGWTGHTVYPYLFPEPLHFAQYLNKRGVRLMFNHHHAAGVQFHEAVYASFARALGMDPSTGVTIEFDIANRTWSDIYFREVIAPLQAVGVNLDWQDFQQQPVTKVPLLNPTITINHAWYTNRHRYGSAAPAAIARDRPFIMGRFGGLGAHRYPIGFVGDTYVKWDVFRYETYFMPTSSNGARPRVGEALALARPCTPPAPVACSQRARHAARR